MNPNSYAAVGERCALKPEFIARQTLPFWVDYMVYLTNRREYRADCRACGVKPLQGVKRELVDGVDRLSEAQERQIHALADAEAIERTIGPIAVSSLRTLEAQALIDWLDSGAHKETLCQKQLTN